MWSSLWQNAINASVLILLWMQWVLISRSSCPYDIMQCIRVECGGNIVLPRRKEEWFISKWVCFVNWCLMVFFPKDGRAKPVSTTFPLLLLHPVFSTRSSTSHSSSFSTPFHPHAASLSCCSKSSIWLPSPIIIDLCRFVTFSFPVLCSWLRLPFVSHTCCLWHLLTSPWHVSLGKTHFHLKCLSITLETQGNFSEMKPSRAEGVSQQLV